MAPRAGAKREKQPGSLQVFEFVWGCVVRRGVFAALEVVSLEPALDELLEKLLERCGSAGGGCAVAEERAAAAGLVGFGAGWIWWLAVAARAALQSLFRCGW